ncbi:MAG: DUF3568 domain-containing protein [Deltaproteobacteria bacterium]|nr:DUF3568 domain-containing protein [Deltaproteobacteria bacterium]
MNIYRKSSIRPLIMGFFLIFALSGCAVAVGALGTIGSGVAGGAEYFTSTPFAETVSYDYDRVKKALLVTLCKMVIDVEKVKKNGNGEKIFATADDLEVVIKLKRITSKLTRIEIKAGEGIVKRDEATAKEIVQRTTKTAAKLIT